MRSLHLNRPFEILKLIRDGELTSLHDLQLLAQPVDAHDRSIFLHYVTELIFSLHRAELIEMNHGTFKFSPLLNKVINALGISLRHLTPYNSEAIVCSPVFGTVSSPPFAVDILVLMPFLENLKPVYEDHIKNVTQRLDLKTIRADDFFTADSIIDDIWKAINATRLLIADCTGRNPNVFYELGIAHTLGKRVILISQRVEDIPFDVQHLRSIIYDYTPRGMQEFEKRLTATLETEWQYPRSLAELITKSGTGRNGRQPAGQDSL